MTVAVVLAGELMYRKLMDCGDKFSSHHINTRSFLGMLPGQAEKQREMNRA